MRGKGSGTLPHYDHQGITPACAGKSLKLSSRTTGRRDHPRVCGEKVNLEAGVCRVWGSPPRMRGKVDLQVIACIFLGITPAYAGKRSIWRPGSAGCGDHPRVCGEKDLELYRIMTTKGSPPRVRGKAGAAGPCTGGAGITPACAGKRLWETPLLCRNGDHPRVCGEKFHPASDRKLGRVQGTKRSSGPAPAAAPAGLAGSCPASPPWSYPPRITVSRPRP